MKANADSWKREPFTDGAELEFRADYGATEFERLQEGFIPEIMEDKWFVYYEKPHLFFHRSWTGQPVYRVELQEHSNGARVVQALWSKDLAIAQDADTQYQAKLLEFLISNILLGQDKPFPRPPDLKEPMQGLFQHHVSGTGYREEPPFQPPMAPSPLSPPARERPWWKLW